VSRRKRRAEEEGAAAAAAGREAGDRRGEPRGARREAGGARREAGGARRERRAAGRPASASRWGLRVQIAFLVAVFAVVVLVAELAGAANLGVALGIGQIAFAIGVVYLLLTR
jgi:hypothetical protein